MRVRSNFSGKQGKRPDLGIFVRSSWEANIARYLNLLKRQKKIKRWYFESKRFMFENITRGTRSYLPDFCVIFPDGHTEWWEVKGYLTQKARTAMKRFRKYYPNETLVIIDKVRYREIEKEFSDQIPKWEGSTGKRRKSKAST